MAALSDPVPADPFSYRPRVIDSEISELLAVLPAISLEGPRAVGKTRTAQQFANTVYNLDDPDTLQAARRDPAMLSEGAEPILIDEWQRLPAAWDLVRRSVDEEFRPGRFLLTGSARPNQLPTHSGAGRIVTLRMWTMSLAERWSAATVSLADLLTGLKPEVRGTTDLRWPDYAAAIVGGGFPGWQATTGRAADLLVDGYLHRIVEHEFPQSGRSVRRPATLRRWLAAYAAAVSTTASYEAIRDAATSGEHDKPSKVTTMAYREILEHMWVAEPVPAWTPAANRLSRLKRSPKHQLADTSLAARLLNVRADTLTDAGLAGQLFESLVTRDLRVYAQSADARVNHMRTWNDDREVDLIVEHADGIVAMEVKTAARVDPRDTRHLRWLADRLGPALLDAAVVHTGAEAYRDDDGIAIIPAALLGP
ncbi:MAG: DUF4143 domain-containing protein [Acidimicrobiaceae bacterium]|nr:DUF4143 domain-containing protein [Acidimicrobiaceae bacterium]